MKNARVRKRATGIVLVMLAVFLSGSILLGNVQWRVRADSILSSAQAAAYLDAYNVVWNEQSTKSAESMPVGGGDVGCNVWAENNSLYLYIGKSDAYDENNQFLKLGRLKVDFEGLTSVSAYRQELKLRDGYVQVSLTTNLGDITAEIWVDVATSTVNIDITSTQAISVTAEYQSWRHTDRTYDASKDFTSQNALNDFIGYPGNVTKRADTTAFDGNTVVFYHKNLRENVNDLLIAHQKLEGVADRIWDPLAHRTFGGVMTSADFIAKKNGENNVINDGTYNTYTYKGYPLVSQTAKTAQSLQVFVHTGIYENLADWTTALNAKKSAYDHDKAKEDSRTWWNAYFAKSYIIINPDKGAKDTGWQIGRNYNLFRYMLGCNAYGDLPSKFNGGMFTFDVPNESIGYYDPSKSGYGDPDFRLWGGGTQTQQNQRLLYWAMLKSGDFEIMPQQLDTYVKAAKTGEALTWNYYGHAGVMFTEQVNFNGLPSGNHYTWNRNDHGPWSNWDLGVTGEEYTRYQYNTQIEWAKMMLDIHRYTNQTVPDEYLAFVESVLAFFQEHYRAMYRALTGSASGYDNNGELVIYPSASMETYKNIVNPIEVTVGLKSVISELLELAEKEPSVYAGKIDVARWTDLYGRIADPVIAEYKGMQMIMPGTNPGSLDHYYTGSNHAGEFYELNIEKPQLYALFPFELYGLGTKKETLDIVRNTQFYFEDDGSETWSKNGYISWHHNAVQAARLGDVANAEYFTVRKLADSETLKFPAFWGPGHDWIPDHNWGASGMIGLQEMVLQCDTDGTIRPFAATPDDWTVYYKLHAYDDTVVEGSKVGSDVEVKVSVGASSKRTELKVNVVGGFEDAVVSGDALAAIDYEEIEDVDGQSGNLIRFAVQKGKAYALTGIRYKAPYGGQDAFRYDFASTEESTALGDRVRAGASAVATANGGSVTYTDSGVTLSSGAYLTIPASAETNWSSDVTYRVAFTVNVLPSEETRILDLHQDGVWLSVDGSGKLRFSYGGTVQEAENGYVTAGGEYTVKFTYGTDFYMLTVNGEVLKTFRTGRASPLPMKNSGKLTSGTGSVTVKAFSASSIATPAPEEAGISLVKVVDATSNKIVSATNKKGDSIRTLEHVKGPSEIRLTSSLTTATDSTGGIRFDNPLNSSGSIAVDNPIYGTQIRDFALETDVYITNHPGKNARMTIFNWSNNGWPTNGIAMYMYEGGVLKVVNDYAEYSTGVVLPRNRWVTIRFTYSETQGMYMLSLDGEPVYISRNVFAAESVDRMATTKAITFGSRYETKDSGYPFVGRMRNIGVYLSAEIANNYSKYFDFPLVSSGNIIRKTDGLEIEGDICEAKDAPAALNLDTEQGLYFGGESSKIVLDKEPFASLATAQKIPDTFEVQMKIYVPSYGDNRTLFFWAGNDYDESGNGVNGMGMYLTADGKVRVSFRKLTAVSTTVVQLKQWTALRLVYTGAQDGAEDYFTLYIDDVEQTDMHFVASSVSSNFWRYAPQLGRTWNGNRAFVGCIDDFSLTIDELRTSDTLSVRDGDDGTYKGSLVLSEGVYEAENRPESTKPPQEGLRFAGSATSKNENKIEITGVSAPTSGFIYEASVYVTAYGNSDMAIFWWAAPNNTYPVQGVSLYVRNDGALRIYHGDWNCEGSGTTGAGAVPLKTWTTVKLEYSKAAGNFKLYLNGASEPTLTTNYTLDSSYIGNFASYNPIIGRADDGGDQKLFKGDLKDIKLTVDGTVIALGNSVETLGSSASASTGVGNVSAVTAGNISEGLYFNGGTARAKRLNGNGLPSGFTAEVEVYVESYGGGDMAILHWGTSEKSVWDFNGIVLAVTKEGKFKLGKHGDEKVSSGTLSLNTWTTVKIEYVKESGKVSVYVSGSATAACELNVTESELADLTAFDPVLGNTTASSDKKPFYGYMKNFKMTVLRPLPDTVLSMDTIVSAGASDQDTMEHATATVTGATEDTSGVGGYKFDGETSKIEITNPDYTPGKSFAIELSVHIEAYGNGDMALVFWGGASQYPVDGLMLAVTSDGKFKLAYNEYEEAYTAAGVMPIGAWTAVKLVYLGGDTDYFELYVDGEKVTLMGKDGSDDLPGLKQGVGNMHANMGTDSIILGRTADDQKVFVGNIKDVRFYHGESLKDVTDNYYPAN